MNPGRAQVARAMYNEGIHLRQDDRRELAVAMWDELFARFASDPPESHPFIPIRGQLAKSHVLAESGRLDAALLTCEKMLEECTRLGLHAGLMERLLPREFVSPERKLAGWDLRMVTQLRLRDCGSERCGLGSRGEA